MLISHIFISSKLLNIHVNLSLSLEQKSFDLGITNGDINPPQGSITISLGGSSTMVMPQILGEYTSMLFQVQQGSTVVSNSAALHFDEN